MSVECWHVRHAVSLKWSCKLPVYHYQLQHWTYSAGVSRLLRIQPETRSEGECCGLRRREDHNTNFHWREIVSCCVQIRGWATFPLARSLHQQQATSVRLSVLLCTSSSQFHPIHFLGPHFAFQPLLAILNSNEWMWPSDLECSLSDTACCLTPHIAHTAVTLTADCRFLINYNFCFTLKYTQDFLLYFLDLKQKRTYFP